MPEPSAIRFTPQTRPSDIPGVAASAGLAGRELSASWYALEPGVRVPAHAHASEELGYVLRGALELELAGERLEVGGGQAFLIPGGVEHGARALEQGCELLECYAPPRDAHTGPAAGAQR